MIFLQPWMLWGLAAASLPILIHLLNRLRFRTVRWGAMMFLLRASRSSTRHARLRQWLILACRTLAVLVFALALARPLVGGWLGSSLSGAPDMVLVLLDRSASMEDTDPNYRSSRREQALQLFAATARENAASRFTLIDSVGLRPMELAGAAVLPELSATGPTDTGADMPAMFRVAVDHLERNPAGRAEIWVASDMQYSNWRPDSREWQDIETRLTALPHALRARVLALNAPSGYNRSLTLRDVMPSSQGGQPMLDVALAVRKSDDGSDTFPLAVILNGTRTTRDVSMSGSVLAFNHRIPLVGEEKGWARIEMPADDNPRDNHVFLVYAPESTLSTAIVGQRPAATRLLRFAAAPHPSLPRVAHMAEPEQAAQVLSETLSLVIWQAGAPPEAVARDLQRYVEEGGIVLALPPDEDAVDGPFGLSWGPLDVAREDEPFRVSEWDVREGPLAHTADGSSLPVDRVEYQRRRQASRPADPGGAEDAGIVDARFADGQPYLTRYRMGEGFVYACASLPDAEWSSLGESIVLLPMVQRMIRQGGGRFQSARSFAVGAWGPDGETANWQTLDTDESKDMRTQAGVYALGDRLIALNRPLEEDDDRRVDAARTEGLMPEVRVSVTPHLAADPGRSMRVEIWPLLVGLAVVFLLAEAALTLTEHVRKNPAEAAA